MEKLTFVVVHLMITGYFIYHIIVEKEVEVYKIIVLMGILAMMTGTEKIIYLLEVRDATESEV